MAREQMKPGEIRDWGRAGCNGFLFFFTIGKESVFDETPEAFMQACHVYDRVNRERAVNDYRHELEDYNP